MADSFGPARETDADGRAADAGGTGGTSGTSGTSGAG